MDSDVQDESNGNQADQAVEHCLRNPVILRTVLRHISNHELVKLSVVNKLWNYEARSVMRKRGNLMAFLMSTPYLRIQPDLAAFAAVLRQMNVVPFSGISIKTDIRRDDSRAPTEAVDSMIDAIRDHLPLKKVSIHLTDKWRSRRTECPAMILGRKLLRHFSGTLQELSLNIPFNQVQFVEQAFQGCTLSSLKILKLTEKGHWSRLSFTEYMKALVSRAPNLEELHFEGALRLTKNVMKGSSAVLIYKPLDYAVFNGNSRDALRKLKVEGTPLIYAGEFYNLETERFNRIYPVLLQDFCLERFEKVWDVDVVLAVRLMRYTICLENVRRLIIRIQYELTQPRLLAILKNFDFTRIFPSLDEVTIIGNTNCCNFPPADQVNTLIEEANAILGKPLPDRAANIKEVMLCDALSTNPTAFYAQMFPNAEKLRISLTEEGEIPFASIWEYWVQLKELEVAIYVDLVSNLDSVICGIFPEEVAELRQMDDEFLKRVNIVPIAPSITHLSNLRSFTFTLGEICSNHHPPLLPSKVTGLLAFAKCPQLAVTLMCNQLQACQMMRDLKPYASVVHEA